MEGFWGEGALGEFRVGCYIALCIEFNSFRNVTACLLASSAPLNFRMARMPLHRLCGFVRVLGARVDDVLLFYSTTCLGSLCFYATPTAAAFMCFGQLSLHLHFIYMVISTLVYITGRGVMIFRRAARRCSVMK